MKFSIACSAALVMAAALFAGMPVDKAGAETATNLKCRGCVGTRDIGKKAVDANRLAPDAKPAGVDYKERSGETIVLSQKDKVVASVNVKAPASGLVVVMANGYWDFDGAAETLVGCSITTGKTYDEPHATIGLGSNANRIHAMSTSRVFKVAKGRDAYRLICRTGSAQTVEIQNPKLTAFYVPQKY